MGILAKSCALCGEPLIESDPIVTIRCSSMGKAWEEYFCYHCYRIEYASVAIPCEDRCEKCKRIFRKLGQREAS